MNYPCDHYPCDYVAYDIKGLRTHKFNKHSAGNVKPGFKGNMNTLFFEIFSIICRCTEKIFPYNLRFVFVLSVYFLLPKLPTDLMFLAPAIVKVLCCMYYAYYDIIIK